MAHTLISYKGDHYIQINWKHISVHQVMICGDYLEVAGMCYTVHDCYVSVFENDFKHLLLELQNVCIVSSFKV